MLAQPATYLQEYQHAIAELSMHIKEIFIRDYNAYYTRYKTPFDNATVAVQAHYDAVPPTIPSNDELTALSNARKNFIPEHKARKLALDEALIYFQAGMAYINVVYPTEFNELSFEIGGAKSAAKSCAELAAMKEALQHMGPDTV